jgi:perosamine synthetase
MKFINQMEPWIGDEEKRALIEYLDSGGWLTEFKRTREFEEMIADYVGSRHAVVVSNGTLSLAAALLALGVGPGDEVIVPDLTMIASANAVVLIGAKPVFVDISGSNLCLDLDLAEEACTANTKAIMLVSLNGRAPDMDRVRALAARCGLYLVEDSAQSLGSRYKGRHLGTFGHVGSFSFSAPKIVTTGQGGALVTDDPNIADKIRKVKDFGRRQSGVDYHEMLGFNFKFTDLQAVIGIEQMKKLEWRVQRKKEMFALYRCELLATDQITFIETDLTDTAPWFIDVLVPDPSALTSYLSERGIGSRPMYPAIHSQPAYGLSGDYPNSEYVAKHGLWLPSSSFLEDETIKRICAEIRAFYSRQLSVVRS